MASETGMKGAARAVRRAPPIRARPIIVLSASAWLVVAALGKLSSPDSFMEALDAHGILPHALLLPATWLVPILEGIAAVVSIWSLLGHAPVRRAALPVLAMFGLIGAYSLWLALDPPAKPAGCGCGFSTTPVGNWWSLAARNLGTAMVLAACAGLDRENPASGGRLDSL